MLAVIVDSNEVLTFTKEAVNVMLKFGQVACIMGT